MGNNEGAGESLIPVEGAASCWVACPRHGGVTRGSSDIGACQPHCHIVLPAEFLIPPVDVLKGAPGVAVNHLLKGIPYHSSKASGVPRFSKLCMVF